jgi:hypothetical protein
MLLRREYGIRDPGPMLPTLAVISLLVHEYPSIGDEPGAVIVHRPGIAHAIQVE